MSNLTDLPKSVIAQVENKTDGRCAYCGKEFSSYEDMNEENFHQAFYFDLLTFDHVVPKSAGGDDSEENLLPVCRSCNSKKGAMPLEKFRGRQQIDLFYFETIGVVHEQ